MNYRHQLSGVEFGKGERGGGGKGGRGGKGEEDLFPDQY